MGIVYTHQPQKTTVSTIFDTDSSGRTSRRKADKYREKILLCFADPACDDGKAVQYTPQLLQLFFCL